MSEHERTTAALCAYIILSDKQKHRRLSSEETIALDKAAKTVNKVTDRYIQWSSEGKID